VSRSKIKILKPDRDPDSEHLDPNRYSDGHRNLIDCLRQATHLPKISSQILNTNPYHTPPKNFITNPKYESVSGSRTMDSNRHRSLIDWQLGHAPPPKKISSTSVHNLLRYTAKCQFTPYQNQLMAKNARK